MKKTLMALCLTAVMANSYATPTESINDQHVLWNKTPIQFVIPSGKQRMISFPVRVSIDNTNPNLTTDKVAILNNNGTLYITAKEDFSPLLLPVHLSGTDQTILVYISGSSKAQDNAPLDVVVPDVTPDQYKSSAVKSKPTMDTNAISMTRFAIQQLGNPRLAEHPENIYRSPMATHKNVNIYPLSYVKAYPKVSWGGGSLTVTAVLLDNISNQKIILDPRMIIGNFVSASFYPSNVLAPTGGDHNQTWLIVTSNNEFGSALNSLNPYVRRQV